ncbi:MAG: HlyD family efflux transporter periplasmic adaptor subunit [Chloroflexales bacterium]|nr:HlyD family efflux transporter periplasmic adaptor subunit [Chloroflexales bacterium]
MSVTSSSPEARAVGKLGSRRGRRFQPWLLLPLALSLAAVGIVAWQLTRSGATAAATSTTTVSRGTLSVAVSGSGTVEPVQSRALAFPVSGTVTEVLVGVGDTVAAGQPLARLDAEELDLAVRQAEANLKSAQAGVAAANGEGATPEEIAAARAQLRSAQASLTKTRTGDATAADIASAESQLASAQAKLNELLAGPTAETLASAKASAEQARLSLESQRASLAAAKTKAESQVTTAANNLRDAQDSYSTIYWQNRQLEKAPGELSQTNKDNEAAAQRAVSSAEESLRQAQLAFEQAKQDEVIGLAQAESQLKDAQEQLAAVADGATEAEIASARASVASAQASLNSLREPASKEDLTIAQASVEQAQINLNQLTSPGSAASIASAEANLAQAEVALAQAKLDLQDSTLTAPFAGVVSEVLASVGDTTSASTTITVIDPTTLYVDLSLSESDVSKVAVGQTVAVTFDALTDTTITGTVTMVAPTATVTSNVATYPVRVSFSPGDHPIKVGMTASGTIVVEQHADALMVPSRAVQSQGDAKVVQVRAAVGQPAVPVRVETGLTSDGQTEILSCVDTGNLCLQEGDILVITASSASGTSPTNRQSGLGGFGGPGLGGPPPGIGR